MANQLLFFFLIFCFALIVAVTGHEHETRFSRDSFPAGFIFGTASASYQYEGAAREGGKGPSIWDTFTHQHPEKIADRSNGDIAIDFYHRYKEDVNIMKEMGLDAFRFSISWPRILPNGSLSGGINKEGVRYYSNFINELLSKGLKPFVTLFHWETPQVLEDKYGSFLSNRITDDFRDYAEICFDEFGDRVKHWITFNEPLTFIQGGYSSGTLAPGRCSPWAGSCSAGDSSREPYIVAHNQLLAHAATVKLYREKYQAIQKGKIGISLVGEWYIPYSKSKLDHNATQRALDFNYGWFMDPLTIGDYPVSMRSLVGNRLPKFTMAQSRLVKGSFDFIGVNYYTSNYVRDLLTSSKKFNASYAPDSRANLTVERNGIPIGPRAASNWLYIYPKGIEDVLLYTKEKYNNPLIYITENGVDEKNDETLPLYKALQDDYRIDFFHRHLLHVHNAIRKGVNVGGYFAWTLLDDFEWFSGYTVRFGINYVDYKKGLKRYPKKSSFWFREFLKK